MQKLLPLIALIVVVIAAGIAYAAMQSQKTPPVEEGVVCTLDAKMCPDGSYVGRTGPKCEFAPCP